MTNELRLAPAQQEAACRLLAGLSQGGIFVMRGQPGMGRTTVLAHIHRSAGGLFLGVRQFLDALTEHTPEAIEEAFLAMLDRAVAESDLVIVDDLHLVTAVVEGCSYARTYLLDAALTAVMAEAVAAGKKLIFGAAGEEPWPVRRRALAFEIAEFGPEDYAAVCRAWLPTGLADRLDYPRIHRFAPALNAHQLTNACRWLAGNPAHVTEEPLTAGQAAVEGTGTVGLAVSRAGWQEVSGEPLTAGQAAVEGTGTVGLAVSRAGWQDVSEELITYLREQYLSSNVDLDEVPAADWRDLKGVDEVIRALEAKIALPFENDGLATRYGLKPKRGVLLAGPPGTGKTTIGRALAHRLKSKFFLLDGTVIADDDLFYRKVRRIFEAARKNAPSVLFIDDTDVIFESNQHHGLYRYLLTMLDGLESASAGRVCVIMTAMNVSSFPRAMLRSGRVELWLETRLPSLAARSEILRALTAGAAAPIDTVDLDRIAASSRGLTGADLKAIVEDGKLLFAQDLSLARAPRPVEEYFLQAIEEVRANQSKYARATRAPLVAGGPVGFLGAIEEEAASL